MSNLSDKDIKYVQGKLLELLVAFKKVCDQADIWYTLAFGSVLGAVRHGGFIPWDTDADVFIKLEDVQNFRDAFNKYKPEGIRVKDISKEPRCLQSHDSLVFEKEDFDFDIHLDIFQLVGAPEDDSRQALYIKYVHYIDKIIRSKYVNIRYCQNKNKMKVALVKILLALIPDVLLKKNIHKRETRYSFETSNYLMPLCGYGRSKECLPKNLILNTSTKKFCGYEFNIPMDYDGYLRRIYGDDYMIPKRY